MKKIFKYLLYLIVLITLVLFIVGKINNTSFKEGNLKHTASWQGQFIDIGKERIRYIQKGEGGQDVLLIHGTPGSIEDWQPIIDSLSTTHRVTAFDRPGNGFSTANNYNYTIKENVIIVNQLIDKLMLDSVVVVGHSYGGSIAARMATTKNDKVKSYVIVASPLYNLKAGGLYKLITAPLIGKGMSVLISKTVASKKIEEGLLARFEGNTKTLTDDFLTSRKQLWSQPKVLYATSKEHINYDNDLKEISDNYKNINAKVSIVYGTNDFQQILTDSKKLHNDLSTSEIFALENTAHFVQFEKPKALMEIIKNHSSPKIESNNKHTIIKEKFFFLKNEIDLPIKKKVYLSTENEVILFRPTEFNFGKMVEDNQSDKLVTLDGNFEVLTNRVTNSFKNSENVKITISEKEMIAITSEVDTLYLNTSKHIYGIIINKPPNKPIFLKSNHTAKEISNTINKIFNNE